jgi:hypothetical protein
MWTDCLKYQTPSNLHDTHSVHCKSILFFQANQQGTVMVSGGKAETAKDQPGCDRFGEIHLGGIWADRKVEQSLAGHVLSIPAAQQGWGNIFRTSPKDGINCK